MVDYLEKVKDLEKELSTMQYNKRTQHHYGLVRAKIARLKEQERSRSSGGKKGSGYCVRKSGDGTVILIGFPSSGKSSLLNQLTDADSLVGDYEFTTLDVVPGLLEYKDAKIQILDVPGIVQGAAMGRGRGKEVLSVVQNADLVLVLLDPLRPAAHKVILREIYDSNVRVNKEKPDVVIKKKAKGGISIGKTVRLPKLSNDTIKSILKEFRLNNADVVIRSVIDADEMIDIIEGNKKYIPMLTVMNKIDLVDDERLEELNQELNPDLCISAKKGVGIEELKEMIFSNLDFMRIYCKEVGKKADMEEPLIMTVGSNIEAMCRKLHKDFVKKFKLAKVWGPSAKFPGQRLMKKHILQDEDVVEIHLK